MDKGQQQTATNPVLRSDFDTFEKMTTRWKDMDAVGHVNNATYLTYLESARIHYIQKRGFAHEKANEVPFIVASIKIDFLKQVVHPAVLFVGQKIVRVGNTSFDILSGIFKDEEDEPSATAVTTMVCFDYKTGKAIPVPRIIREELERE
ncbi:MAG: acyl-CoA thioesterase [Fidelibacterota bacterium]